MKVTPVLTLLFGLCAVVFSMYHHGMVGGGRGRGNHITRLRTHVRGNSGHFKRQAAVNIWLRDVTSHVRVLEKAVVKRTSQMIILRSVDPKLSQADVLQSASAYDFNNNFVAVKIQLHLNHMCLILPGYIAGEYWKTSEDVMDRNTVVNTDLVGEFTMTGDGPLTHSQVKLLNSTLPGLMAFCHRRRSHLQPVDVVDVREIVHESTDLSQTRPITVMTINGKVTLYLKMIH